MIDTIIKNHIQASTLIGNIPVHLNEEPTQNIDQYIFIKNNKNSKEEHMRSSDISIYCYGANTYLSRTLGETVETIMESLTGNSYISKVRYNAGYQDNDVARKKYRYHITYTITEF